LKFLHKILFLFGLLLFHFSCDETSYLPREKAFLRLEFEKPMYGTFSSESSKLNFIYNNASASFEIISEEKTVLRYKHIKIDIVLSNIQLENTSSFEESLQNFYMFLEPHRKKSNQISVKEFISADNKRFAKVFEMRGPVASPLQFYVTDSINNFLFGSMNLIQKSDYDSIYPSVMYVKNDIFSIIESVNWEE
jgi:gliding motility-associated lipoprotein GldD